MRTDSIPAPRLSVELFEDPDDPRTRTRVMDVWPAHDSFFDATGALLEEVSIEDPDSLVQQTREWYGEPFEVIEAVELGRFITPYGKRLDLGEEGFTWLYDVTDYAPLLVGDVDLQAGNTQSASGPDVRLRRGHASPRRVEHREPVAHGRSSLSRSRRTT